MAVSSAVCEIFGVREWCNGVTLNTGLGDRSIDHIYDFLLVGHCNLSIYLSFIISEILQLVFSKSIPVLLYGLEALPLTRSDERSLDFTFNRFMMKLFGTTDMNIIKDCQAYFGTQPPSEILAKRRCKFLEQYRNSFNCLCRYCCV